MKHLTLALAAMLVAAPALAQQYPDKPVRVIVPAGAGSSTDTVTRLILNKVKADNLFSQPFAVLNVTGGGGPVAFHRVKDAAPDGYELLVSHVGMLVSGAIGRTPFGPEAFEPVAQTGSIRYLSVVADASPYKDFKSFVAAAQATPNQLQEANALGGAIHMASLLLAKAANYQLRLVQVGDGPRRFQSVLGGHTIHTLVSPAEYKAFQGSGIRPLAFVGQARHPDYPQVPSTTELGFPIDFAVDTWWFAPKGTPKPIVDTLAGALEKAMGDAELRKQLADQGVDFSFLKGAPLQERVDAVNKSVIAFAGDLKTN